MWPIACLVSRWILLWWELWCTFKVLGMIITVLLKLSECKKAAWLPNHAFCVFIVVDVFLLCVCSVGWFFLVFCLFVCFPDTKGGKSQWASYLCVGKYLIQNTFFFFSPDHQPIVLIIMNTEMLSKLSWFQILLFWKCTGTDLSTESIFNSHFFY